MRRQIRSKEVNLSVSSIEITLKLIILNEINRNTVETKRQLRLEPLQRGAEAVEAFGE